MSVGAISSLNSIATAASSASSSSSSNASQASTLNLNFTTYLKILTTQLQNQDPTNATDPNQFTQELIEMEQVQSQITNNTDLENLVNATSANGLATGTSYVGAYVRASTSSGEFSLHNSAAEIGYTLPSAATSTTINVEDSSGNVVAQLEGGTASGDNYVTWNGVETDGSTASDGTYTFVVNAVDSGGNAITSTNPTALFYVTGVQSNSDGTLTLDSGDLSLLSTDVTGVYAPSTLPTATTGTVISSSSDSSTSS
ncbi:MAG: FlgD immunoglobulin-like domain containing protein [Alphaproteobacteria bacterium]|nr:FlgD immunoglobulin-like domain containing protein [Alphaproteobacteria bacterium]